MKNKAIRCLFGGGVICVAAVLTINSGAPATFHRQLSHRMADARTLIAAVRYLAEWEGPDFQPRPAAWEFAETNLTKTPARFANRVLPNATNLPSLTISNGVATTQTNETVPG